jgi:hypothetical protein
MKVNYYKALTKMILDRGESRLGGRTPHETVRSSLGTNQRFKRIAEGVYALSSWEQYPVARFAKDIAYDVLKAYGRPMSVTELGKAILKERKFVGGPRQVACNSVARDSRFIYDVEADIVRLSEWLGEH